MQDLDAVGSKRTRWIIGAIVTISVLATIWSTLIIVRTAESNRRAMASLFPLLQQSQTFEREILSARIAFIYHVTIQKPGSLETGWDRYYRAKAGLAALDSDLGEGPSSVLLKPRQAALDTAWEAYGYRLRAVLHMVANGTHNGPDYNREVAEWAAEGDTLVNTAHDFSDLTVALSRAQSNGTAFLLHLAMVIVNANGALWLILGGSAFWLRRQSSPAGVPPVESRKAAIAFPTARSRLLARSRTLLRGFSGRAFLCILFMLTSVCVVLGTGLFALRGLERLTSAQSGSMRSQQVLIDAASLRVFSTEVESDTRGFVFSGHPSLLISQQNEMRAGWKCFDKLSQEAAGDAARETQLRSLHDSLQQRFDWLSYIGSLRQNKGAEAVSGALRNGSNLSQKHQLEEAIAELESAQYERLAAGMLEANHAAVVSKTLILFAAFPAALGLGFLGVVTVHLLTRGSRLQEQLAFQANHDALTGLPNRFSLDARLSRMLDRASKTGTHCAVFGIDLDHFKHVNDRFGHGVGDLFLRKLTERFTSLLRASDTLIRVGGDEFLCLAESMHSAGDAEVIATKLIGSLTRPIEVEGVSIPASVSVGIAVYPEDAIDTECLRKKADAALYRAKSSGRNQFCRFEQDEGEQRRELIKDCLEQALECNYLHLVYQPQYSIDGSLRGLETLLRLDHPTLGPISPAEFIPLAEESGFILPIGSWVLEEACTTYAGWLRRGFVPGLLAVNVSASQFARRDFSEQVVRTLAQVQLHAGCLELELTESMMLSDPQESDRQMRRLEQAGVRLAIDDFGTGYSSLSHLNRLPISTLKIDQTFVRQLGGGRDSRSIIEAIVALGKALSMEVIAEGVESESERSCLVALGCDHLQGYLFARPMETAAVELLLALQAERQQEQDLFCLHSSSEAELSLLM